MQVYQDLWAFSLRRQQYYALYKDSDRSLRNATRYLVPGLILGADWWPWAKENPMTYNSGLICNTRRWRFLRLALPVLIASACAGCGLAGTAVATGAGAAAEVQQAQQAKADEDKVKRELDQAQHDAAQQRENAESQGK